MQHLCFFLETCYNIATKIFLRDLITRVFMRSIQNGIVVLGFLDAFVYAHHEQLLPTPTRIRQRVLLDTYLVSRTKTSAYQSSKPDIRTFPMVVPQNAQEELTSEDGLFIQTEVLASWTVKLLLDGV